MRLALCLISALSGFSVAGANAGDPEQIQILVRATAPQLPAAFPDLPAEERTVIEITRGTKAQANVGDVIRVSGRIPSGQGVISVEVKGPGKLISTSSVRQMSNGRPLIGSSVKEFEIKAEAMGKITITVIVDNRVQHSQEKKEYTVEVK